MKIKLLDENNLKIIFDYKELEENNISVHSFLSNSKQAQDFLLAILNIANEDFGFNITNNNLSYETFSFKNIFFIILITKLNKYSSNFDNTFFYKLRDINDLLDFCDILNTILPNINFKSSLYQYNNLYFLKLDFTNLTNNLKTQLYWKISEFKNTIFFDKFSFSKFNEFSTLIIQDNALSSI